MTQIVTSHQAVINKNACSVSTTHEVESAVIRVAWVMLLGAPTLRGDPGGLGEATGAFAGAHGGGMGRWTTGDVEPQILSANLPTFFS